MPLRIRCAQPVHHIVRDHEISLRALSRRDPPLREESVIGGAGEPTTPGSPRWVARVGLDLLNLLEVVHYVQPRGFSFSLWLSWGSLGWVAGVTTGITKWLGASDPRPLFSRR